MSIVSSIRALTSSEPITLELRAAPNLNNPAVPLGGVGFGWAYEMGGGNATVAGETINDDVAMRITTVYACIRVISQSIASLPCILYERVKDGSKEATNNPLHYLLSVAPNVEMSAHKFWGVVLTQLHITGNSYVQITRNKAGQVAELYPLSPTATEPYRDSAGVLGYRTRQGQHDGNYKLLRAEEVLHFSLLCSDGVLGMSPIKQAREALGLTRAAKKSGSKLFGNGARPGGLLTGPINLTIEQTKQSKESWESAHGGSNQGGTAVLPGDWSYTPMTLSPEDSQFIQLRGFQRTEIAALYGVPPNMVGDNTRLSNSNHEQQSLSFVIDTLRPVISTLEGEINRKLLPTTGRKAGAYYAQFDLSERLRGDFATQTKGYALGKQWGWYSTNDIRRKLGENTLDDPSADVYMYPVNMANAEQLPGQADLENIDEQPGNMPVKDPNDNQS